MTRIAIGGLMHESNTFAPGRTDLDAFVTGGMEVGEGIARRWGPAHHEVGGFFEAARATGFEPVPTFMAWATPAGPLDPDTYRELVDRLVNAIREAGPVDAVLLALHGAMVADGQDDADGETLERVRALIGPDRPLVVTLDFHANVSLRMAAASDAIVAYRTYPHTDQRERGSFAASLAHRAALGLIRPTQALRKPPLLIHLLAQETSREPLAGLMAALDTFDPSDGFLDASLLAGFPFADVREAGPSCLVVTDGAPALAEEAAESLATRLWSLRRELTARPLGPREAVSRALAAVDLPVVLADLGDNVGGGSAADSTVLLHELSRHGADRTIAVLFDPESVRECVRYGIGAEVSLLVGGKSDENAPPFPFRGRVRVLHDGRYVEDLPRHGGLRINDQGLTAVVEDSRENTIVLTSLRHPPFSLGQLTSLGLRPEVARVLVVKAALAYKAAYEPIAGTIVEADTPGLTCSNPERRAYHKIRRSILPLDSEADVEAAFR